MRYDDLILNLKHPESDQRLAAVRVLGVVEETEVLPKLRGLFNAESDPAVKDAIEWAGKRIFAAEKRGYHSLHAVFEQFMIYREIEHMEDPREADLEQQMQTNFIQQMANDTSRNAVKSGMMNALGGAMMGGAVGAMGAAMNLGAGAASSNLGVKRPEIGKQRIPPQIAGTTPIDIWVKRLRNAASATDRKKAILQLLEFNNPAALPHLAEVYLQESLADMQTELEKAARTIYLKMRYWDWSNDGTIDSQVDHLIKQRFGH